ncbi:MAG: sigma 54-interacting transcriptional regulator [Firmicutes bacterium]|nr:sigma 54-interacting transcriptional regulator [Bacillota bacterium]
MSFFDELFDKHSLYFDAFDRMNDAFYVCDENGHLIYINKVAERLDGYMLSDIKGKSTFELYGLDKHSSPMLRALYTERPVVNEEFTYYVNGREIVQICNSGPIYESGQLVGAYTMQRDLTQIKEMMERNLQLQREISNGRRYHVSKDDPFSGLIGKSEVFRHCVSLARKAAKTNSSVMLIGNTGCGKEVFANAIHEGSDRRGKPFLALNCAAIPETLIEGILFGTTKGVYTGAVEKEGILAQADGGTVFLDEVNSMPLASQAKLLRVLEERKIMKLGSNKETPIDIRVVSSINESPAEAIRNGHIREDLFYRLSVVQVVIPPLRERIEDIPELVHFFIDKYNERFHKNVLGVEAGVMSLFMSFPWQGNVRHLKACIESAMNFATDSSLICASDLPVYIFEDAEVPENRYRQFSAKNRHHMMKSSTGRFKFPQEAFNFEKYEEEMYGNREETPVAESDDVYSPEYPAFPQDIPVEEPVDIMASIRREEKEEIIHALQQHKGNITKAAESLGLSRQSLSYRMKKYHIH